MFSQVLCLGSFYLSFSLVFFLEFFKVSGENEIHGFTWWICHEYLVGVNSPLTWAWRKLEQFWGCLDLLLFCEAFTLCWFPEEIQLWQSKQSQAHNGVRIRNQNISNPSCCRWFMPSSGVVGGESCETPQRAEQGWGWACPSFLGLFAHDNIVQHRKGSQRVSPSLVWSTSQTARTRACLCWIYHNGAALFKDITSSLQSQQLLLWRPAVVIDVWNISWPQRCVFTKIHFKFALACSYFQGAFHFLITWSYFFAGLLELQPCTKSQAIINLIYLLEEKLSLQRGASLKPALLGPPPVAFFPLCPFFLHTPGASWASLWLWLVLWIFRFIFNDFEVMAAVSGYYL